MQQMLRASQQLLGSTRCAAATRVLSATRQPAFAPSRQPAQARAYTGGATDGDEADAAGDQPFGPIVFTSWPVYKGKAALQVKPVRPKWSATDKGGWALEKEGSFMFEMAHAVPGSKRQYDWANKILISLRPLELAQIIRQPQQEHTFYHDTFKGTSREGTLVKTFKWTPAAESGYFISVTMTDKQQGAEKKSSNVSCSISDDEYVVFELLVKGSMVMLHGFDLALGSM